MFPSNRQNRHPGNSRISFLKKRKWEESKHKKWDWPWRSTGFSLRGILPCYLFHQPYPFPGEVKNICFINNRIIYSTGNIPTAYCGHTGTESGANLAQHPAASISFYEASANRLPQGIETGQNRLFPWRLLIAHRIKNKFLIFTGSMDRNSSIKCPCFIFSFHLHYRPWARAGFSSLHMFFLRRKEA